MKYLFIKTYRDILKNWLQFLAVFIMAMLSVTIYSGMEGVWQGLNLVVTDYYKQTQIADAWIYSKGAADYEIDEIKKLEYVTNVSRSMSFQALLVDENMADEKSNVKLRTLNEDDAISVPLLQKGDAISYPPPDSIWLDSSFAEAHQIKVGETLKLSFKTTAKEFIVSGLVLNPEYIYYTGSTTEIVPNHTLYGYGYISEKTATDFLGALVFNEARLQFEMKDSGERLQADAESIFGDNYLDTIVKDDVPAVSQIIKEIAQMKIMAQMFSFVFILLALLTMYTTMSRLINTQTVSIGLLKALGFSDGILRMHYSLYGFAISAAGGLIGSVLGPRIVSPAVMQIKKATLTLPHWEIQVSLTTYLIVGLIVFICTVSCLIAAQKGLGEMPALTMRGVAPKSGSKMIIEILPSVWKRLSFEWRWILRDMNRSKARSIMGVVGVIGGLTLIIAGFGFRDSIAYSNGYVYHTQYKYQEKLLLHNPTSTDQSEIETRAENHQWVFEASAEFAGDQQEKKGLLTVLDEGELIYFENLAKKEIDLPQEGALISRKLAQKLGVAKGEPLKIHMIGTRTYLSTIIADIIYSPAPQGVFISKRHYENLAEHFSPTAVFVAGDASASFTDIKSVQETVRVGDQEKNMEIMSQSVMTIIRLLIIASILLSVVILYNLGALNFVERYREYATMKVLGFHQHEIRSLALRECFFTTLTGWIIGVPVGILFLKKYISIVAFDAFEWMPHITPFSFVLASCVIIFCSAAVTVILSHRISKVNMVEALKSVE